jgi:hypothetical protein
MAIDNGRQARQPDSPTLMLGVVGFSRGQELVIEKLLADRADAAVAWRIGALAQADAWWANGARTQPLDDGSLCIDPGEPGGRQVRLAPGDVSRPIAFSMPLASRDFEPAYSFRIDDPASMASVLQVMQTKWLAGTAVRLELAGRLIAAEHSLAGQDHELVGGGRVLAMLLRTGDVALMPGLTLDDLDDASWRSAPATAASIPASFQRTSISDLVWSFALRSQADLLPARYRSNPIYFRRPPKVAQALVGDEHLLVSRELALGPASFAELEDRTGLPSTELARALAALYLAGSITSNPRRVERAVPTTGMPVTQE